MDMDPQTKAETFDFSDAIRMMKKGVRMTAAFLPRNIFITIQFPERPERMEGEGDMDRSRNTEPYLKMVTVRVTETENTKTTELRCEPWEPGRRSVFFDEWFVSPYEGADIGM